MELVQNRIFVFGIIPDTYGNFKDCTPFSLRKAHGPKDIHTYTDKYTRYTEI